MINTLRIAAAGSLAALALTLLGGGTAHADPPYTDDDLVTAACGDLIMGSTPDLVTQFLAMKAGITKEHAAAIVAKAQLSGCHQ